MRGPFLLLGLLAAALGPAEALKLKLNPYQVDCVTEIAKEHDRVSGSFVGFLEGRHYGDVYPQRAYFDLEVKGEDGYVVYRVPHRQDSKFEFVAPKTGRYFVCIRNYGRHIAEILYHSHVGGTQEDHGKLTTENLQPLKSLLRNLKLSLADMLEEALYQERRDHVHYIVNESTDKRAVRTTAMETTAIVVISIVQIVYVRKLFAKSGAGLLPRFGV